MRQKVEPAPAAANDPERALVLVGLATTTSRSAFAVSMGILPSRDGSREIGMTFQEYDPETDSLVESGKRFSFTRSGTATGDLRDVYVVGAAVLPGHYVLTSIWAIPMATPDVRLGMTKPQQAVSLVGVREVALPVVPTVLVAPPTAFLQPVTAPVAEGPIHADQAPRYHFTTGGATYIGDFVFDVVPRDGPKLARFARDDARAAASGAAGQREIVFAPARSRAGDPVELETYVRNNARPF